ncbi:MAG: SCO family protein [Jatrophihabitantaceae bacterium]
MNRRRNVILAAVLLVLAAFLAGCSSSGHAGTQPSGLNDQNPNSGPYQGVGLDTPRPRPSFTLTDTAGQPFAFGTRTAGHPTLLFFGYTSCPDVCPTTMADIDNALKTLPLTLQKKIYVVFVSTDVKHDTASIIARWLQNFDSDNHASFVGLRGTQSQINLAEISAHILVAEDGGQTHSTQVLLFGPDDYARVSYVYSGTDGNEAKQMAHDLPIVAKA